MMGLLAFVTQWGRANKEIPFFSKQENEDPLASHNYLQKI